MHGADRCCDGAYNISAFIIFTLQAPVGYEMMKTGTRQYSESLGTNPSQVGGPRSKFRVIGYMSNHLRCRAADTTALALDAGHLLSAGRLMRAGTCTSADVLYEYHKMNRRYITELLRIEIARACFDASRPTVPETDASNHIARDTPGDAIMHACLRAARSERLTHAYRSNFPLTLVIRPVYITSSASCCRHNTPPYATPLRASPAPLSAAPMPWPNALRTFLP